MDRRHRGISCSTFAGIVVCLVPPPAQAAFTDVSVAAHLVFADVTYGLGWGDFDLDGRRDLHVVRHYFRPIVYRNEGPDDFNHSFSPMLFDTQDHHGPLIADFDQDGDLDIYITAGTDAGASVIAKRMYRNDGSWQFPDVAHAWGVTDSLARGRSSSATDVDGDGDVDFYVAKSPRAESPNSLFLNDGTQNFTDVAASAGIADAFGSVGGVWGDYDRDGDPDLLIGGEEQASYFTRLYRNDGNVTFTNVTSTALPGIGLITSADWGDYDKDGDLDLAIGLGDEGLFDAITWGPDSLTFFFNSRAGDNGLDGVGFTQTGDSATFDLYINGFYDATRIFISGDGHNPPFFTPFPLAGAEISGTPPFTPGAEVGYYLWANSFTIWQMRANTPPAIGTAFAGRIRMVNGSITGVSPVSLEPFTPEIRGTRIYRNDGGVFTDVTLASSITDTINVRHVTWVDVDLDGWLDLYVLNKGDTELLNQPNVLYRALGDGTFADVTAAQALAGDTAGLADVCAFEDYDNDGDLDVAIISGTGPRYFATTARHKLYRNDGPTGNRLRVDLVGDSSTIDGYGAWVTCVSSEAGRQTHYVAGNAWRGANKMIDPFFGLGTDTMVDTLRVEWPSGPVTVSIDVPAGDVTVVEPEALAAPAAEGAVVSLAVAPGPNPTRRATTFSFAGRRDMDATIEIFDARGRNVRRVSLGRDARSFRWNGRDDSGARVSAGVYFARLREGERRADVKVVLLP